MTDVDDPDAGSAFTLRLTAVMLATEARGTASAIMASTNNIQSKSDLVGVLVSLRAGAIYDLFGQIHLHNFFTEIAAGRANGNELDTSKNLPKSAKF